MKKLSLNKKALTVVVAVIAVLAVTAPAALAWQEGPGTDWWYINAQYEDYYVTGPLVIEIDGDSSAGQTFTVGDTVNITCYVHAYAASCAGDGNGAWTNATLDVSGPSGSASDNEWGHDSSSACAEVNTMDTLAIAYALTAAGTHQVYMNSNVQVSQYWADVAEETVDASLTFEVAMPVVIIDGCDTGVTDQVLDGSTISEKIAECEAGARNHGQFVRCVAHLTNDLVPGYITGREKGAIQSCAAQADIP